MIIKKYSKEDTTEIYGDVESVDCTIKTDDSKLFHILSNLYSRPLNAVVRELSTNCLDGHKVVGKEDTPFHISINDSVLDDEFNITFRDFGPGMSKETIVKVFSTFGESTKINSNLETGCLGLGSKSPFAVTSSFMVISYIDNIKYTYNMSKNAVGRPTITLFNESFTDEPNGMQIVVPLDRQSFDKYMLLNAIELELNYFKCFPEVFYNNVKSELKNRQKKNYTKICHGSYLLNKDNTSNAIYGNFTVQGEIGYSMDIQKLLKTCFIDESLSLFETKNGAISTSTKVILNDIFMTYKFHMFFANGSLMFAPSREELIYDLQTVKNILKMIIKTSLTMLNKYHSYFESLNIPELFAITYNNLKHAIPVRRSIRTMFFGITDTNSHSMIRKIYLNNQPYFGIEYTNDEKTFMGRESLGYLKRNEKHPDIYASLNIHGNFKSSYNETFSDDSKWAGEKFNHICVSSNNGTFIDLASLRSNRMKYGSINPLYDINTALYCFVDLKKHDLKSFKQKIYDYAIHLSIISKENTKINLIRYNVDSRFEDWKKFALHNYGVSMDDLKIISSEEIDAFHNANKVKTQKVVNNDGETVTVKITRDEIPFYTIDASFSDFKNLKVKIDNNAIFSNGSSFKNSVKIGYDEKRDADFIKNTLYFPLDNKKKSKDHLKNAYRRIVNTHSLIGVKTEANTKFWERDVENQLDVLTYIRFTSQHNLQFSYKSKISTPLGGKKIVIMNEEKAKKLGLKSFADAYTEFVSLIKDFSKLQKSYVVFDHGDSDSSNNRSIRVLETLEVLGFMSGAQKINDVKYPDQYISHHKSYKKRIEFSRNIVKDKFRDIKDKLFNSKHKDELMQHLENFYPRNKTIMFFNSDCNMSSYRIVDLIKYLAPNVDIIEGAAGYSKEEYEKGQSIFMDEVYYLERIGYVLFDSYIDDYRLAKNNSYKINKFITTIDGYLINLNNIIYEKSVDKTKSFIYKEPVVEVEKDDEKKEIDSEDESISA